MSKYQYRKAPNPTEFSVNEGIGKTILDLKTVAKDIPCQEACPAKTNVPAYIEQIFKGDHDAAYRINQEDNVFPGVLGRICTRPCQDACRHNWTSIEGAVEICHLKRAASDNLSKPAEPLKPWFEKGTGKKVAVIGGGPAGLTAARELDRYGHEVTIFEREAHLGGMLMDGIPKFRLPRQTVQKEIDLIAKSKVNIKLGANIDQAKLAEIISEFDSVLMTVGTMIPNSIELEGLEEGEGLYGLKFMKDYNNGDIKSLKGDVVIIGGGFTAVDCSRGSARAARKLLGAEDNVTIVYRRSEQFMAANQAEMEEIRHENISIRTLCTPVAAIREGGELSAVRFQRNVLDDDTDSEKPRMIPVPNSEFDIPCKHLIVAIGQTQDWSMLPDGVKFNDDQTSSHAKLFAAGDFLTGSNDVIHAVAEGKAVADRIDQFLTGEVRKKTHVSIELIETGGETGRFRDHDLSLQKTMEVLSVPERSVNDAEVEMGFKLDEAELSASRCYLCQYKFEINQDKCIHCDWCIDVAPRDCIKRVSRIFHDKDKVPVEYVETSIASEATYIYIDSDECVRCGKCLRVCPTEAISMVKMARKTCLKGEESY